MPASPVRFTVERSDAQPGTGLLDAFLAEIEALYGPPTGPWPSADPDELAAPGGAFLVGRIDDRAVACGGVKTIEVAVEEGGAPRPIAEIKRMYVAPDARGRGVARALLAALEEQARAIGHDVVRLDTGPDQPDALHLYRSAGYRDVPDYNGNARATHWLEKRLG
ncbi:GNAT family N-acetyltransferase [Patulibacter defluvii]|uniref:GNAT family N-acetyltransferase n=1 Tax=Patulibacter defluvii TaxID=3095358 RepID=UPI002A752B84|nr:GNAT family N-acetyltransferase [Patulibacter sp. DM4]